MRSALHNWLLAAVLLLTGGMAFPLQAVAALENSFGVNGVAITDFGIADDAIKAMAVQADGKIVVAGLQGGDERQDAVVARFTADGKPDLDFHGTGSVSFNPGEGNASALTLALQEDGKIVVAGSSASRAGEAAATAFVARLSERGELDASFGANGLTVLNTDDGAVAVQEVKISGSGALYLAGTISGSGPSQAMLARLSAQGTLDASFGEKGVATVDRDYITSAQAMVLAENTIYLGGYSQPAEQKMLALYRFTTTGQADSSFGERGEVKIAVNTGDAQLHDLLLHGDGALLATGSFDNGQYREILLAKFLSSGQLDSQFGENGLVRNDLGRDSYASALGLLPDGALLASGALSQDEGKDVVLLRYGLPAAAAQKTAGAVSSTAGAKSSYLLTSLSSYDDESHAMAVLADGKVLAAGYANNGEDSDFVLMQYSAAAIDSLAKTATASKLTGLAAARYSIVTTQVTGISRNGALSGGVISENIGQARCSSYCQNQCASATDASSCYSTCVEDCSTSLTVTERGVCYGVAPHPVYRADSTGETTEDSSSSTSTSSSATTSTTTTESNSILPSISAAQSYNYTTVLYGQTSDGSGTGAFGSTIVKITPDTQYYVRAYAVLADGTVLYGNELSFRTSDACFIATAAFGSHLDRHVSLLREFRDRYLTSSGWGKSLVRQYYHYSPAVAAVIEQHELLKAVVRIFLYPLVLISYLLVHGQWIVYSIAAAGIFTGWLVLAGRLKKVLPRQTQK